MQQPWEGGHTYFLRFPGEETEALASTKPLAMSEACLPPLSQMRLLSPEVPGKPDPIPTQCLCHTARDTSLHYLCDCLLLASLSLGHGQGGIGSTVFTVVFSVPGIQ